MIWVAQVTEPSEQGEHNEQYGALQRRFPGYDFSIMLGEKPFVIARPRPDTIHHPEDNATETEMLRHMVTELINELITGYIAAEMEQ